MKKNQAVVRCVQLLEYMRNNDYYIWLGPNKMIIGDKLIEQAYKDLEALGVDVKEFPLKALQEREV